MARNNAALRRELTAIRAQFRQLAKSFARIAPFLTAVSEPARVAKNPTTRRKPKLTAQQQATLKPRASTWGRCGG